MIKVVKNVLGIDYSITIITIGTLEAALLRDIWDLIPFLAFLTLLQFISKYLL